MVALIEAVQRRGYTKAETAMLLRSSERTVDRMLRRGELPFYRVGLRAVRIPAEAVEARLKGK